jgi:uncharacterized membrane protein YhfC
MEGGKMPDNFPTHLLNALLMIAMPVGLAIFLTKRWKLGVRLWLIGAATFILSQIGHIPFNSLAGMLLNRTSLTKMSPEAGLIFNAVFLGLSAGLFEELFRYGMFRWWAKDARSWRKGILTGAGHSGAEAIIFGAIALYTFVQFAYLQNADLSKIVPAGQLAQTQQQLSGYWSMDWFGSLQGALERLFAIPTQIAFAVLVLQTFTRRQWFWVWLAVLYHAALDAGALLLSGLGGALPAYAFMAALTLVNLLLIFRLRQPEPVKETHPSTAPAFTPGPVATPEK